MTDLPTLLEPLVDADTDCSGFPFMPIEVLRVRNSDLIALTDGDQFKAAFLIWTAAWHQVPASSVPDDDRILAKLAMVTLSEWKAVREMALHGFIKCADGRLYHPLIADLAMAAKAKSVAQSKRVMKRWAAHRNSSVQKKIPAVTENDTGGKKNHTQVIQLEEEVEQTEGSKRPRYINGGALHPRETVETPKYEPGEFE